MRLARLTCTGIALAAAVVGVGAIMSRERAAPAVPTSFRQIRWPDLVPANWDQFKTLRAFRIDTLRDGDPRAQALLADMRTAWDNAPANEAIDGAAVRMSGFVVPLESDPRGMTELLLVPYEGACIHSPPPPANQIVHVTLPHPVKGLRMMDNVWLQGTLRARRETTFRGVSGYEVRDGSVEKREAGK